MYRKYIIIYALVISVIANIFLMYRINKNQNIVAIIDIEKVIKVVSENEASRDISQKSITNERFNEIRSKIELAVKQVADAKIVIKKNGILTLGKDGISPIDITNLVIKKF